MDGQSQQKLYKTALALAFITMSYNIVEGVVSAWLGAGDESLSLFGFGLDSFVEVVSGAGIWHMVRRQREEKGEGRDVFERRALRITGYGFFVLAAGLTISGAYDWYSGHAPKTTVWGILISLISMLTMWLLIHYKIKVGTALGSQAIISDAACTKVCLYLSVVLLAASAGFEATGIGWIDAAGAFAIAWICLKEGREALGKAKGLSCGCSCNCS
jgi:divalent metal cation (Fe/Co/Zn/Cd) transporter